MVWREGSLSHESRRALLKLRSLGGAASVPELEYAPRLRSRDAAFEPLRTALDRGIVVRFDYLKPGDESARRREVAPAALVQHQGRWLVSAVEVGTGALKTFLLSRVVGPVQLTTTPYTRPDDATAERALADLEQVWRDRTATVRVEPLSDAETRLVKRRGTTRLDPDTLLVHWTDDNLLADELASFGPEVTVVEPDGLRALVRTRLEAVLAAHTTGPVDGGARG